MSFTVWVQSDTQTEAQEAGTFGSYDEADEAVYDLKAEADVVMCDAMPLDEARAKLDLDGKFIAAWRMRVADASEHDTVAIVEDV